MQSNFFEGFKKFGLAQNILGPVKGQGRKLRKLVISAYKRCRWVRHDGVKNQEDKQDGIYIEVIPAHP